VVGLDVAESYGERVGGVSRLRSFRQGQQSADHDLDLTLVGMAVTSNRSFYFARRIAVNGDAVLGGRKQYDASDFGEAQRGTHVESRKDRLNGHHGRREFLDESAEEGMHVLERGTGELLLPLRFDAEGAIVDHFMAAAIAFDDAVAGWSRGGGIDAKNAEAGIRAVCRDHRLTVYGVQRVAARGLSFAVRTNKDGHPMVLDGRKGFPRVQRKARITNAEEKS